jgi:hypothetical protein
MLIARFQEPTRWLNVVRKSGGSWWITESLKLMPCCQLLVVFGGENRWRRRVERERGEGWSVDGGCMTSVGDGSRGGGWTWWQ